MSSSIRPAIVSDLPAIVDVFLDCWSESYGRALGADFAAIMGRARAEEIWAPVVEESARSVRVLDSPDESSRLDGLVRFVVTVDPAVGEVHSLYVSPSAQGRGVGRRLLGHALSELEGSGCTSARLWVFEGNAPSRAFYERVGWHDDGRRRTEEAFGLTEIGLTTSLPVAS